MSQWLIIDASAQGEIRLSLAHPGPTPVLGIVRSYRTDELLTFTDALMRFERESGVPLAGVEAALAIAGAVCGNAIPVARTRWTISQQGLDALFRRRITIINDVAARAWATRSARAVNDRLRGDAIVDPHRTGRHMLIMVHEGVGCATVDIDAMGIARIVESEGGHLDFSPGDPQEQALAASLREATRSAFVSWEHVLMLERGDPVMTRALPKLGDADRQRLLGTLLGRFAVNMMLSSAAWNGVLFTGSRIPRLLGGEGRAACKESFEHRRPYRRPIAAAPCQVLQQSEPVLMGLAAMLAERHRAHALASAA